MIGNFPTQGVTPVERARSFLMANAQLYGLTDPRIALHVRREASLGGQASAVTFYQLVDGLLVRGAG